VNEIERARISMMARNSKVPSIGRIQKRKTNFSKSSLFILLRPASWPKHGFGVWLARAAQRLHPNVLAAALANKLARIAWTVLAQERSYEARVTKAAA
jgi:transposase